MVLLTASSLTLNSILVSIVILNSVSTVFPALQDNTTTGVFQWETGRTKRSPPNVTPEKLTIKVKLESGEEIDLAWVKTDIYVANKHLPVVTLLIDVQPNVMHNSGEFVLYQDVTKCSAVVYFKKSNTLFGVIRSNYYIRALPYDFNERGEYHLSVIGAPYILKRQNSFPHIHLNTILPPHDDDPVGEDTPRPNFDSTDDRKRKSECNVIPNTKHQRTNHNLEGSREDEASPRNDRINDAGKTINRRFAKRFYLETLVFVSRDIVELFKQSAGDRYIQSIVKYYIVYFNALDMIFKQLRVTQKIMHINIAKIIIEDEMLLPFDFMTNENVEFTDVASKLSQYLYAYPQQYPPDSFDYVFVHTSRTVMNGNNPVNGWTKHGANLVEARKRNQFYDAVPMTVVQYRSNHADYLVAAHEIGRMVNLKMDPPNDGSGSMRYCYGIMQRGGPKCDNCLTWSVNSRKQYETFFRQNPNRCFLLNAPRSLSPPGASRFTSAYKQCQCLGYDSYISYDGGRSEKTVKIYGCNEPLRCQRGRGSQSQIESTVEPFDGTPCTEKKVCWNRKCVPFQ